MGETTIGDVMTAYAADAVQAARRRGVELDFSESSLALLDELLGREGFIGRTPRTPSSPEDEELLWSAAKTFGAYVGEVAIRSIGGAWDGEESEDGGVTPIVRLSGGLRAYPVGKVWKRLTESQFDSLAGFCRAARAVMGRHS